MILQKGGLFKDNVAGGNAPIYKEIWSQCVESVTRKGDTTNVHESLRARIQALAARTGRSVPYCSKEQIANSWNESVLALASRELASLYAQNGY